MKKMTKSLLAMVASVACVGSMAFTSYQKVFADDLLDLSQWTVTENASMGRVEKVISTGANEGGYSKIGNLTKTVNLDERKGVKLVSVNSGKDAENSSFTFNGENGGLFTGAFETDMRVFSEHSMVGRADNNYIYRTSPEDIVKNVNGYADVAKVVMTFTDPDTGVSFDLNLVGGEEGNNSSVHAYVTSDKIPFSYRVANSYDNDGNPLGLSFTRGEASAVPEVTGADKDHLYVPKSVYQLGEPIYVVAEGTGTDWIGIKKASEDWTREFHYIDFSEGGSGSNVPVLINSKDVLNVVDKKTNLEPGDYEIVYCRNNGSALDATASAKITIVPHFTESSTEGADKAHLEVLGKVFEAEDCIPVKATMKNNDYDWIGIRRGYDAAYGNFRWIGWVDHGEYVDINQDAGDITLIHEPGDDYGVIFVPANEQGTDGPANSCTAEAHIKLVSKFMNDLKPTALLQTSFANVASFGENVGNDMGVLSNKVGFDPATMEVYGYARTSVSDPTLKKVVILDLDNMEMAGFESAFADTFKGNYSVKVTVGSMADNLKEVDVNGEKKAYERHASMMVYSVNGHQATKADIAHGENIPADKDVPENVTKVMALIDGLGDVSYTEEFKAQLDEIKTAYNALSDEEKLLVLNADVYTECEKMYGEMELEHKEQVALEEAKAVDEKISAIGAVTLDSKKAIEDARASYNALSETAKAKVTKLEILENAEKELKALEDAEKPTPDPDPQPQPQPDSSDSGIHFDSASENVVSCKSVAGGIPTLGVMAVLAGAMFIRRKRR